MGSISVVLKLFHWKYRPKAASVGTVTVSFTPVLMVRPLVPALEPARKVWLMDCVKM